MNTSDILNIFKEKYSNKDFRILGTGNDRQQTKTLEIQGAHFIVDKPWIVREPNFDYFKRELAWYDSQSLYVDDIPGKTPDMWKKCADIEGKIVSNYGWCIYSNANYNQYKFYLNKLYKDPHTREATMIYTRPSMVEDGFENGMHDFMCTYSTQWFLNDTDDNHYDLDCHVFMRSNDAVFGFNNDALWHSVVMLRLMDNLNTMFGKPIVRLGKMIWNTGSLHIYERHFNLLNN